MSSYLHEIAEDLISLVYPGLCASCDSGKPADGHIFCVDCIADLPETEYHLFRDNPLEKQFWGRVDVRAAAAKYYFSPGGATQGLLHNIKYRGHRKFAQYVGEDFGKDLASSPDFKNVDLIVPVPLHWKRLKLRGYNQSEEFAAGIARSLEGVVSPILRRVRQTETQTLKTRAERVKNMSNAFCLDAAASIYGKHILLVDDVVTTGATLESCAIALSGSSAAAISIGVIACGKI